MIGNVIIGDYNDFRVINKFIQIRENKNKIKEIPNYIMKNTLIESCIANTFQAGCRVLFQTAGISGIRPNVIIIKMHQHKSQTALTQLSLSTYDESKAASHTPQHPLEVSSSNSVTDYKSEIEISDITVLEEIQENSIVSNTREFLTVPVSSSFNKGFQSFKESKTKKAPLWFRNLRDALSTECGVIMARNDTMKQMEEMSLKVKNGKVDDEDYIDIWWLYDDGGLTVLIGYLLQKNVIMEKL